MLQLKNITKVYAAGDNAVQALDGIDLSFRRNEFVSILGQSGCGKTTLLNIVGGLDRYTDGDLIINGKSTKQFKDRDWDTYRNHTIGFVFQSYNLIPHQTVLQNVELALTLSGVPKAERRRRAKAALEQVGLGDQLRKKPGEMSGGQMQRVAIARALVNDPAIILADEPTGALDTETSVQVMNLLKEVARDRLVVMVTHNPDLAMEYSTRIIRMLDGKIIDDSAPLTEEELAAETALEEAERAKQTTVPFFTAVGLWLKRLFAKKTANTEATNPTRLRRRSKKPSMSFFTAFGLSLKNLFTKKGRTTLTAFAGSIGIIGIALISAVSNGMTTYIDKVQEDTLSSYPITLEATHTDMGSLLTTFMGAAASHGEHDKDAVYQKAMMYDLVNSLNNMSTTENDLKAFKSYLEKKMDSSKNTDLRDAISGVQYGYDLDLMVYTENVDGTILRSDVEKLLMELMVEHLEMDMSGFVSMSESYGFGNMMTMGTPKLWQEILPAKDGGLINPLLYEQYEIIDGGRWPSRYDEIVLVVDENNEIDDMTLYALGLKSKAEMDALAEASKGQHTIEVEEQHWSYEEIRNMEFRVVFPYNCYEYDATTGLYRDIRVDKNGQENPVGLQLLYDNALPLKVTGIIRPKEDATSTILSGNIAYTSDLTAHIIRQGQNAPVVQAQLASPDVDVTTGLPFQPTANALTVEEFTAYLETLDKAVADRVWATYQSAVPVTELTKPVSTIQAATSIEQMKTVLRQVLVAKMGEEAADKKLSEYNKAGIQKAYLSLLDEQRMNFYKSAEFMLYVQKLDVNGKANAYVDIQVADRMAMMIQQINQMSHEELKGYIQQMISSGGIEVPGNYLEQLLAKDEESLKSTCVSLIQSDTMQTEVKMREEIQKMMAEQGATPTALAYALDQAMGAFTTTQFVNYFDNVLAFSETTYEDILVTIGKLDLDSPASISIYAASFEDKDVIEAAIDDYNKGKDELDKIVYTDYIGLMMSSVTTIINAITYVLIAFVAISLVVSSIMIGVITLISVQERTKEIGILRSIGASKRNVSSMFNAETVIIGFAAGLLGVLITYLLCIPINLILHIITGIPNLSAILPWQVALTLIGISILLTLFAGIIPSRSAAKKDPVVALRTE